MHYWKHIRYILNLVGNYLYLPNILLFCLQSATATISIFRYFQNLNYDLCMLCKQGQDRL